MLHILTGPPDNSDVLTPLDHIYQTVRAGHILIALFFFLILQVTVIKNLAEEEKKDAKAFLKQQPFAKPGNICEKLQHIPIHNRFYRRLSWSVSMGTEDQRLLFSGACSNVFHVCEFFSLYGMVVHCWLSPAQTVCSLLVPIYMAM